MNSLYKFDNVKIETQSTALYVPANNMFYLTGHFIFEVLSGEVYLNGVRVMPGKHSIEQSHYSPAFQFTCLTVSTIKFSPKNTIFEEIYTLPNHYLQNPLVKMI